MKIFLKGNSKSGIKLGTILEGKIVHTNKKYTTIKTISGLNVTVPNEHIIN